MRKVAFLALFLCSTSAFAANVSDFVRKWKDLKVGDAKTSQGLTFTVGHATFTTDSAAIVTAGDDPVGLFLGKGTLRYESANKDEFPTLTYNAKAARIAVQANPDKMVISEPFTSALLLGNGLPSISGDAIGRPDWQGHRDLFGRDTFSAPPAHLFAYQALDAPASRVVRAEINGASRPYVYEYDDALDHIESLDYLHPSKDLTFKVRNVLWTGTLSRQAIGHDNRDAPPARIRLTDVDVNLAGKMSGDGVMTIVETLVPQQRPAAAIHFDLNSDIWYDIRREPKHFNLRKVVDGEGHELDFVHSTGDLVVALAKPAPVGQPLKLRFEIDGDFLHRQDKTNFWELGIDPWFPWLHTHEQAYTFHAVVKTEKPFIAFASGKTIRREEDGDSNVIETKLDLPVSAVSILAGKYQFEDETRNGVTVRVASFIVKNKEAYKQLRNIAFSAIEYYPTFLGPWPFEEVNVIEKSDDFGYGQAPAGIVFITGEAFTPKLGEANAYIHNVNLRFAHELAHAYWGGVVCMPSGNEQWIEEAFAEYSAALFLKASKKMYYDTAFGEWKDSAKEAGKNGTIPTANQLDDGSDGYLSSLYRQDLIYAKGAILLAALHQELGDQQFMIFMKSYQKSFRWKYGTTKNVIGLLQFMTKKDYAPWFEENYYGTGLPDVKNK